LANAGREHKKAKATPMTSAMTRINIIKLVPYSKSPAESHVGKINDLDVLPFSPSRL
jgi:hypothetical protein